MGSTGHWPVPSGDSPDGMGRTPPTNDDDLLVGAALLVPVVGSPTGTGGSPVLPIFQTRSKSVAGNCMGSTGHWPVPSGDSPDGMGRTPPTNDEDLLHGAALLIPVGGSPTGTGGSPVLPIFQTRSKSVAGHFIIQGVPRPVPHRHPSSEM